MKAECWPWGRRSKTMNVRCREVWAGIFSEICHGNVLLGVCQENCFYCSTTLCPGQLCFLFTPELISWHVKRDKYFATMELRWYLCTVGWTKLQLADQVSFVVQSSMPSACLSATAPARGRSLLCYWICVQTRGSPEDETLSSDYSPPPPLCPLRNITQCHLELIYACGWGSGHRGLTVACRDSGGLPQSVGTLHGWQVADWWTRQTKPIKKCFFCNTQSRCKCPICLCFLRCFHQILFFEPFSFVFCSLRRYRTFYQPSVLLLVTSLFRSSSGSS